MKYHPITDSINLLQSQRSMLQTPEFDHVYPSLSEFLEQVSEKGFNAKKDLSHLLDFLVTTLSSLSHTIYWRCGKFATLTFIHLQKLL